MYLKNLIKKITRSFEFDLVRYQSEDHYSLDVPSVFVEIYKKIRPYTMISLSEFFLCVRHQWMYDRHSLKRLLEQTGFVNVKVCVAAESRIPEYEKYSLDVLNGITRKPDSLYIEASKP